MAFSYAKSCISKTEAVGCSGIPIDLLMLCPSHLPLIKVSGAREELRIVGKVLLRQC